MTDEQTVERVAKAIHENTHSADLPWDHEYDGIKENCRKQSRAAIATMQPALAEAEAQGRNEAADHACAVIDAHSEYDESACCDGRECCCGGETVHEHMKARIRALIDTEAAPQPVLSGTSEPQAAPVIMVQEAAQTLLDNTHPARDIAFGAMWDVVEKNSLEATNSGGARYSITGDIVNELYYAALRALAGEEQK